MIKAPEREPSGPISSRRFGSMLDQKGSRRIVKYTIATEQARMGNLRGDRIQGKDLRKVLFQRSSATDEHHVLAGPM